MLVSDRARVELELIQLMLTDKYLTDKQKIEGATKVIDRIFKEED